ncbi:MAG: hypothetical protein HOH19_03115, partial [Kordiimonadaceae bacterium]|nr:hypothetical protein [Kordiimonadaceae bacterium]
MSDVTKNVYSESSQTPNQSEELFEFIRSIRRYSKDYRVIHMHFSILDRLHQQPHHRRIIATSFNKLINSYEGKIFWLQNFDFFFICKGCTLTQLEQVKIDALRAVEDSPILKQIISQNKDDELCDWYDLGIDYERFLSLVED